MKRLEMNVSGRYPIIIEENGLENLGEYLREIGVAHRYIIISEENVAALYLHKLEKVLAKENFVYLSYVFLPGEKHKTSRTYIEILSFLAQNQVARSDCLIALGGGIVGDMTGFCAATYLRGIDFIQIPTTLLAMVDSSVGGKTGIDLPQGKNLVGAFYQPRLVVCDYTLLNTLSKEVFEDGMAEVIKYGAIYDRELWQRLALPIQEQLEEVIARCIAIKKEVVSQDEFDKGIRKILNFGHTLGHGIEAASHFEISHGRGVAMGMDMMVRIASHWGLCDRDCISQMEEMLERYNLREKSEYGIEDLLVHILKDKKRQGGMLDFIILSEIGKAKIYSVEVEKIEMWLKAGLI